MQKSQANNNNAAVRENLYALSLIRGVTLLGQVMALLYFTWVQPIGLPVAEISFVLSVYASLTAAIWLRSRRAVPIGDSEFLFTYSPISLFFQYCYFLVAARAIPLSPTY